MNARNDNFSALFAAYTHTQTVIEINHYALEEIITTFFYTGDESKRVWYEIPDLEEVGNDVTLEFNVIPRPLTPFEQITIDLASKGEWKIGALRTYIQALAHHNIIPRCKLNVRVSW
jgi:hypothetical protein